MIMKKKNIVLLVLAVILLENVTVNQEVALADTQQLSQTTEQSIPNVDPNIAKTAEQMLGYFSYGQVRPVPQFVTKPGHQLQSLEDVNPYGITDCSGFVWLTLRTAGYNVDFPAGSTENMKHLEGGWETVLKEIPQSQAQPGDIVVVSASTGNGGHTGILDGSYNGNDLVNSDTPFINVSDGPAERGPIKNYFATLKYFAPVHVYRANPSAKVN